jgi:hypothetical protein
VILLRAATWPAQEEAEMGSYVLLYHGGGMPQDEAEGARIMQAWTDWFGKLGDSLVDPGNPFSPQAKSVAADGSVSDGPVGEGASGYSIVKADSLDAATAIAKGCPVLQSGATLSVFETFQVM